MKALNMIFVAVLVMIITLLTAQCSGSNGLISKKKKQIFEENQKIRGSKLFRPGPPFRSKYDLKNISTTKSSNIVDLKTLIDCFENINFRSKQVKIEAFRETNTCNQSFSSIEYNTDNKIYLIQIIINYYEDEESAVLSLENQLQSNLNDSNERDPNCPFELCFINITDESKILSKKILIHNVLITYNIMPDYIMKNIKIRYNYNDANYNEYARLNLLFYNEFGTALDYQLLKCKF